MPCNNYTPRFQDQINSYDPLGPQNCTCYSGAMAGEYHTCGAKKPTGKRVRELTGDTRGGTTLIQVDAALYRGWGIDLDTRIGSQKLTWDQFEAKINAGRGAILQGSYAVIQGTRFQGDANFTGNHAVYVPPTWAVMDPLCDGRRPGIYRYHGERYPKDLLRRFAGTLELSPGNRLGIGWVWCSLTKDNTVKWVFELRPEGSARYRAFRRYFISDQGKIYKHTVERTAGFSATCSSPRTYQAAERLDYNYKRLVRLTSGSRAGWYVSAEYADSI